jgi:hypothetical protein
VNLTAITNTTIVAYYQWLTVVRDTGGSQFFIVTAIENTARLVIILAFFVK